MKEIYFAGGCFWGTEHYIKQIRGVVSTEVGYANGNGENPTYEEVYTDLTGFAECEELKTYDYATIHSPADYLSSCRCGVCAEAKHR